MYLLAISVRKSRRGLYLLLLGSGTGMSMIRNSANFII